MRIVLGKIVLVFCLISLLTGSMVGYGQAVGKAKKATAAAPPTYQYQGKFTQGQIGELRIPAEIKNKLPELASYLERANTTHENQRSDSLTQVGLRINDSTGTIFGSPTQAGQFRFLIEVQDQKKQTVAFLWAIVSIATPATPPSSQGELLILKFVALQFLHPVDWERALLSGCVVYTNVGAKLSTIQVTLPDGSLRKFAVPLGREVIVCGEVIYIDTRPLAQSK